MQGQKVDERQRTVRTIRDERLRVRHWRRDQFLGLGFSLSDAAALAKSAADLADTRRLIGAGCAHGTAFRIVR